MRNLMRIMLSTSLVAGLAAGAVAQPAKPAPPPAKTDSKPAPPPTTVKPEPPAAMTPPAPSAEVAAYVKANAGAWKCTGKMFMPDGSAADMKATIKTKFALDKFWAQISFAETKKNGFKFEAYRTFDGKKWHSVMTDNWGSQEVSWSDGPKDGKTVWQATSRSAMGEAKGRHHEELLNPKEMKMWGEYSMDKGKTWMKAYEASCKK